MEQLKSMTKVEQGQLYDCRRGSSLESQYENSKEAARSRPIAKGVEVRAAIT
jgi:hypothetical protein